MRYFSIIFVFVLFTGGIKAADEKLLQIDFEESFDKEKYFKFSNLVEVKQFNEYENNKALRVTYEAYNEGTKRITSRFPLITKVDTATFFYDVCFETDFQWVKGGKLHGLSPDAPVTGGNKRRGDGWSARILFKEKGKLQNYLYDQNTKVRYGFGSKSINQVFFKRRWHRVTMQLQLNAKGKYDGFLKTYVDGVKVVENNNVIFRTDFSDKSLISNFLFSTFHGGNKKSFAPQDSSGYKNVHAWFDNFTVLKGIHSPVPLTNTNIC